MLKPFQPVPGGTIKIANATSASSPQQLPKECDQVSIYNSSASALAFVCISGIDRLTDTGRSAVVDKDLTVPPGALIRVTCAYNYKTISVIASEADGSIYVTPGHGN